MAENQNKQNQNPLGKKPRFSFTWIYIIIIAVIIGLNFWGGNWEKKSFDIDWYQLETMLARHDVDKIAIVNKEFAEIFIKDSKIRQDSAYSNLRSDGDRKFFVYKFASNEDFITQVRKVQEDANAKEKASLEADRQQFYVPQPVIEPVPDTRENIWGKVLGFLWPIILIVFIWFFMSRMMRNAGGGTGGAGGMGNIFSIGKSKGQVYDGKKDNPVTFADVAGLNEAKVEVMEIVDFLKNPKKYTDLGGKIPKGALLVGPPGTGKTLLAKAVAGEAGVPFLSLSGSDFVEMFVGVGASRVRDLFKTAKEKAPCIIFIDEIDAVGRARGKNAFTGGNDERESTLNQLLTEMDGFGTNGKVIILAATNRADILDKALLRAGRFDRQIHIELPELDERKAIFAVHSKNLKMDSSVDLDFLAKQTPGFSGADIANVCNEAALIAARANKKVIGKQDFIDAVDRIVGGLEKRGKFISQQEKRTIAYHESGHATVSWMLQYAAPLFKVTIVPRGKSLGAAWYLPDERQITTFEQMFDEMTSLIAGRTAEEVFFGQSSTGALNDLERITKMAYAMISFYGMNSEVGTLSFYDSSGESAYGFQKPYSERTAEEIDKQVKILIEKAHQTAKKIITKNKDKIEILAATLLEKEVIFRDDVEAIFGKRPFEEEKNIN